jgi:hypothetical protein
VMRNRACFDERRRRFAAESGPVNFHSSAPLWCVAQL